MGDQEYYHHGEGAMGGQLQAAKHQDLFQYREGGGGQYAQCPTEQRFQVFEFQVPEGNPLLLTFPPFFWKR